MTTQVNLGELGITQEFSADNFGRCVAIVEAYNAAAEKISETETENSTAKTVREGLVKSLDDDTQEAALVCIQQIREILFRDLDDAPDLALILPEMLSEIRAEVVDERDYLVSKEMRRTGKTETVSVTLTKLRQQKAQAEAARDFAKIIFQSLELMSAMPNMAAELAKIPSKNGKDGKLPEIPRIKSGPRDSGNGSSGPYSRLRMAWAAGEDEAGEILPAGTLMSDVAHDMISQGTYRVSAKDIRERVLSDNGGKSWGDTHFTVENPWSVKFETGTLYGWADADA